MLRNDVSVDIDNATFVLNEVLSLNAQESRTRCGTVSPPRLLNEVLSLNAQEYSC